MGRASTVIVIFLVLLTASANLITASGVGAALDIQPDPQGEEAQDRVVDRSGQLDTSQGVRDTLQALFSSVTDRITPVYNIVFAAPIMFQNLGVPSWLTTFFFAGASIIVLVDSIHVLTGRDL